MADENGERVLLPDTDDRQRKRRLSALVMRRLFVAQISILLSTLERRGA